VEPALDLMVARLRGMTVSSSEVTHA
jgi:hypothetical protein